MRVLSGRDRHACVRAHFGSVPSGDPLFRLRAQGGRTGAAGAVGTTHSGSVQRFAELPANVADEFREIVEEEEADLAEQSTPNEPSLPNGRMIQPRGKAAAGSAVVRSAGRTATEGGSSMSSSSSFISLIGQQQLTNAQPAADESKRVLTD